MSCGDKCDKRGCHSSLEPLCPTMRTKLLEEIEGWSISLTEPQRLMKTYEFEDFAMPLEFVNEIGNIAEEMNHHPYIQLAWGKVSVEIWTHAIDDLAMADFILAREVDYARVLFRAEHSI